jgi:hypothetical protein
MEKLLAFGVSGCGTLETATLAGFGANPARFVFFFAPVFLVVIVLCLSR